MDNYSLMKPAFFVFLIFSCLIHSQVSATPESSSERIGSLLQDHEKSVAISNEIENFERRRRALHYESKLQEERDRLEKDRLERLGIDNPSALRGLPDLTNIPKWGEVANSARFKGLDSAKQAEVKAQYFDEVIAPHAKASGANVDQVRQNFLAPKPTFLEGLFGMLRNYWHFAALTVPLIFALALRKKLACFGKYAVDHAYQITALAVALVCAGLFIRSLFGPIFVLIVR